MALRLLVRLIAYRGYKFNFQLCIFHFPFNCAFSIFHSIMQPAWIYGQEFAIHDNSPQITLDSYILVWGLSVCVKIIFIPPFICVGMNTEVGIFQRSGTMEQGTIKRLTDKGFGFIADGSGNDLFFHMSSVEGCRFEDLQEGQKVSYNVGTGPKGPRAENVRPV